MLPLLGINPAGDGNPSDSGEYSVEHAWKEVPTILEVSR